MQLTSIAQNNPLHVPSFTARLPKATHRALKQAVEEFSVKHKLNSLSNKIVKNTAVPAAFLGTAFACFLDYLSFGLHTLAVSSAIKIDIVAGLGEEACYIFGYRLHSKVSKLVPEFVKNLKEKGFKNQRELEIGVRKFLGKKGVRIASNLVTRKKKIRQIIQTAA